jgi:hypothetical protein
VNADIERALEAVHEDIGALDRAIEAAKSGGPEAMRDARDAVEALLIDAWRLSLRVEGLPEDEIQAWLEGWRAGRRDRQQRTRWVDPGSGPGWSPDDEDGDR